MIQRMRVNSLLGAAGALCLTILPGVVHAQVVSPIVTYNSATGLYHYDYTIINTTGDDLFDVDIHVLPGVDVVSNVSTPAGFTFLYDSGLGLVAYTEDIALFTAVPLNGFTYDSILSPGSSTFDANFAPASGGITTTSGSVLAAVPEPGSMALFASMGAAVCIAWRKRRR